MGAVGELQAKLYRLAFSRFMLSKSREAMRGSGHIRLPPGRSEGSAGRQRASASEVGGESQRGGKTRMEVLLQLLPPWKKKKRLENYGPIPICINPEHVGHLPLWAGQSWCRPAEAE